MVILFISYTVFWYTKDFHTENLEKVSFLDVGQGDAIFIESPTGTQVLIDGGRDAGVLRELTKVMGFFDRGIDLVVATHPDMDHIGGLIDVLKRYDVATVLMTENESDSSSFASFNELVQAEGARVIYVRKGQVFDLGLGRAGSITLHVLFPDRDPRGFESNVSSIVTQLQYGDIGFMLTGDSPQSIETYLVSILGNGLESEVLKAGHHGSRTSSNESFVRAVHPEYAIISAGKSNSYGHPHKEIMSLFQMLGITTKNTAESGSVSFESNGEKVWTK